MPRALRELIDRKPVWVIREIQPREAEAIATEIRACGAVTAIEIGVASGFSSAVILNALRANGPNARLYAFDLSPECYFDRSKKDRGSS